MSVEMCNAENKISSTTGDLKEEYIDQSSTSKTTTISSVASTSDDHKPELCITEGCNNVAIQHLEWDNEYCSVSCCYNHCQTTFRAWLAANKATKMKNNTVIPVQAAASIQQPIN